MRRFFIYFVATIAIIIAGIGCQKENTGTPVNKPTIGILDPEFDAESMTAKVMIAPSTDATAWYWMVKGSTDTDDAMMTKVEGAAAQEIEFAVIYGVEYTITAYAENKAGKSDIATKKFCQMPKGEVTVAIGEITLNAETMEAEATIYPSSNTTKWYWRAYEKDSITTEWIGGEGSGEQSIAFAYEWGKTFVVEAYAECGAVKSEEVSAECYFEPSVPTITVSKPIFDEATMTLSFEVTPSDDTHHWYWGIKSDTDSPSDYEHTEGAEAKTVSTVVEYDKSYTFLFRAENAILKGNEKEVEFAVMSPGVEIAIENLTGYSFDAVITKKEHCVRYVAGALHTDAYDRNIFIEQAQSSLNPDDSYPFAVFNSATDSRTFSEQDLVRNSLITSDENSGIMLVPGTSYTIAVYSENAEGLSSVVTKEFVAPTAELNGNVEVSIAVSDITETSAVVTADAGAECKIIVGCVDPDITKADTENPFDFEGKSDAEISDFLVRMTHAIPTLYREPVTRHFGNLVIGGTYYAYAIAIKDGKVGNVAFKKFATKTPSLTGVAKITEAEILEQTTHEALTVKLTTDGNATKVRLYAAPESDHSAYADNLEYILNAEEYQNYREEYAVVDGVATAVVDIYHPASNYYLYASAVDSEGKAGEMVCVAQLAGLETTYYTTIDVIEEEINIDLTGTGTVDMVVTITNKVDDRISLTVNTDSRSANAQKVWLIRYNGKIDTIEDEVKYAFSEYADTKEVKGSYKEAKVGYPVKYEDGGSDWDPKYEALQEYNATYGGDILVAVVLDTNDKFCIYSYYTAGGAVKLYN